MSEKVLIIGGGGREHALAWKIAQSSAVTDVFVAPGNAGTELEKKVSNLSIPTTDIPALCDFAKNECIDLTIVGPEMPLAEGIVDVFAEHKLTCFGPSQQAAQLESSKTFAKQFMQNHGIPSARYASFSELEPALNYIQQQTVPLVIKADGLAAGKGVVICTSIQQACQVTKDMLQQQLFGQASQTIIVEEYIRGQEVSFIALSDGQYLLPLASAQDHKARDDGDRGPNTGGMGAYSPTTIVTPELEQQIMQEIMYPTIRGMAKQGTPYQGFLYAGLMISPRGEINVLEYNCRLGDPEAQVILLRLQSDLYQLCQTCLQGTLSSQSITWDKRASLGVVLASAGYPEHYPCDEVITGLSNNLPIDHKVFHAGTQKQNHQFITSGGRVLCVCALAKTISEAQQHVYQHIENIHWDNMYYRKDIGNHENNTRTD